MKKRVAIFVHGGASGGLFRQGFPPLVRVIQALNCSYDVTVFTLDGDGASQKSYRIITPWLTSKYNKLNWLMLFLMFTKEFFKKRFHCTLALWGYPAGFIGTLTAKIFGIPSIVIFLGGETANIPGLNYGMMRGRLRSKILWVSSNTTKLIVVSRLQQERLIKEGVKREIQVIPWGSDRRQFNFRNVLHHGILKMLHVANLTEVKDQATLLKVFAVVCKRIPSQLRIVGPDYMNGAIQKLASELQISGDVVFTGAVPHTEIHKHYAWADCFVLTSLAEGQNQALMDAMTCGLLAASTDVGAMEIDFGNKIGVCVPAGGYQELAERLIELYSNQDEWRRRTDAAIEYSHAHDFEWTMKELQSQLNECLR